MAMITILAMTIKAMNIFLAKTTAASLSTSYSTVFGTGQYHQEGWLTKHRDRTIVPTILRIGVPDLAAVRSTPFSC